MKKLNESSTWCKLIVRTQLTDGVCVNILPWQDPGGEESFPIIVLIN